MHSFTTSVILNLLAGRLKPTRFSMTLTLSWQIERSYIARNIKFPIKDFFSKCDQIFSLQRIWSYLLKMESLMENFILCPVLNQLPSIYYTHHVKILLNTLCPFVRLYFCLFARLSVCVFAYLPVCLFVHLSISAQIHFLLEVMFSSKQKYNKIEFLEKKLSQGYGIKMMPP